MRYAALLIIFVLSCQKASALPELGSYFNSPCPKVVGFEPLGRVLVSPSESLPSKRFKENGQIFVLGFDALNRVAYIETADPSFRSPEGIAVGSTLKQVDQAGGLHSVLEAGWGHYLPLPSGWSAVFESPKRSDSRHITRNSRVLWFFKRNISLIHEAYAKTRPGYLEKNPGVTQTECAL